MTAAAEVAAACAPTRRGRVLVRAEGVHLALGGRTVLEDVDVTVRAGEVVGLVGRNGAGKTTLLHVLLGLVGPGAGRVERPAGTGRVGVAFDGLAVPTGGSVDDALRALDRYLGGSGGDPLAAEDLRALVGHVRDRRVGVLSHGTRQRLSLAAAVLGDPDLVVLDEPYNGLDPVAMAGLGRLVRDRARRGAGVLLSSHYVAELDELCDRVVLLDRGHVVLDAAVEEVVSTDGWLLETTDPSRACEVLRATGLAAQLRAEVPRAAPAVHVRVADPPAAARALRLVVESGVDVVGMRAQRRGLADVVSALLEPGGGGPR